MRTMKPVVMVSCLIANPLLAIPSATATSPSPRHGHGHSHSHIHTRGPVLPTPRRLRRCRPAAPVPRSPQPPWATSSRAAPPVGRRCGHGDGTRAPPTLLARPARLPGHQRARTRRRPAPDLQEVRPDALRGLLVSAQDTQAMALFRTGDCFRSEVPVGVTGRTGRINSLAVTKANPALVPRGRYSGWFDVGGRGSSCDVPGRRSNCGLRERSDHGLVPPSGPPRPADPGLRLKTRHARTAPHPAATVHPRLGPGTTGSATSTHCSRPQRSPDPTSWRATRTGGCSA